MPRRTSPWRVREPRASSLTELCLITAVATILVVRAALALAGYPQVGSTLHIAHMLWGGLLMIAAFLILLQAADPIWKPFAAFVFGIGLGLFLDEIGKFVTKDNDYFFKPAVALMYVVLVLIMLLTRLANRLDRVPSQEHTYHAARAVSHLAVDGLTAVDREQALARLAAVADPPGPLSEDLKAILQSSEARRSRRSVLWAAWDRAYERMLRLGRAERSQRVVVWVLLASAIGLVVELLTSDPWRVPHGIAGWVSVLWQVAAGALALTGAVAWLRKKRLRAFRRFHASTIVTLLFGQVYDFADSQFLGMVGLLLNLAVLGVLRLGIVSMTTPTPTHPPTPPEADAS